MTTPPFFIGLILVFWGWEAGLLPLGLIGAVILELARVIRWRWEFSETDMRRAWDFCGVLFVAAAVYGYATTDIAGGPSKFMPWMPVIFFPFVVAATYSAHDRVRFSTYFWLLRRKGRALAPDKPLGWFVPYWYFVVCFIAASMVNARDVRFYAAVVLFGVWMLWLVRNRTAPAWSWALMILMVAAAGFGGHIGLARMQAFIENRASQMFQDLISTDVDVSQARTAIGSVGKLKQSNRIVLRIETDGIHPPPELLRRASFNVYQLAGENTLWSTTAPEFGPVSATGDVGTWNLAPRGDTSAVVTVSMFLLRGTGVLPVPNGPALIEGLLADSVQTNRWGSVRVREAPLLVRYSVKHGERSTIDAAPDASDLLVPREEATAVGEIANELGLAAQPATEALRRVQTFFGTKFTYRMYMEATAYDPTGRTTALSQFLLRDRAGHCEFFASAATLLLRQAGVPARYAVGYAVPDEGRDAHVRVVRARHAHSWTLAYVDGTWKDFDTTPASWEEVEEAQKSALEPVTDLLAWMKYRFFHWRYYTERRAVAKVAIWLAAIVVLWFGARLFGKKRASQRKERMHRQERRHHAGLDSEFYRIERHLAIAGFPRRDGESLGEWMSRLETMNQSSAAVRTLREIVQLHYAYRFDPSGITHEQRRQLRTSVEAWFSQQLGDGHV